MARRAIPTPMAIGMVVSAVVLAAVAHYAIAAVGDLAGRGRTVPAFIGVEITAILGGLLAYGKFVMDFARANHLSKAAMRGQVRDIIGVGAFAVLTLAVHIGWTGTETARVSETVPGVMGSALTQCFAALAQFGLWVIECSRYPKGE